MGCPAPAGRGPGAQNWAAQLRECPLPARQAVRGRHHVEPGPEQAGERRAGAVTATCLPPLPFAPFQSFIGTEPRSLYDSPKAHACYADQGYQVAHSLAYFIAGGSDCK